MQALDIKEESQMLSDTDIAKRFKLKRSFESKVREEEIKWKQRSRCRWLKEGDRNTKIFHIMATTRMMGNRINYLIVNGDRLEDREGISIHIDFFNSLYNKDGRIKPSLDDLHFSTITGESANWLEGEFQEEEIRASVFHLASDKAPGPDDFPMSSFQKYWDLLRDDIMAFMKEFHSRGRLS